MRSAIAANRLVSSVAMSAPGALSVMSIQQPACTHDFELCHFDGKTINCFIDAFLVRVSNDKRSTVTDGQLAAISQNQDHNCQEYLILSFLKNGHKKTDF